MGRSFKTEKLWNGIPYTLVRSSRRTMTIEIDGEAHLTLRGPLRMRDQDAEKILNERRDWIWEHMERMRRKRAEFLPYRFVSGEKIWYLGRTYTAEIEEGSFRKIQITDDRILLPGLDTENRLRAWYQERAVEVFNRYLRKHQTWSGPRASRIRLSDARTRWGSCSAKGSINLSWRLIQCPEEEIEEVVVHELTHLKHMDHSPAFWADVARVLPDCRQREKRLKELSFLIRLI